MSIAKKLRFNDRNINKVINVPTLPFPPNNIKMKNLTLHYLGESNKTDLYPEENESDVGIYKAVSNKTIGQYTYCDDMGNIYEALLYIDDVEDVILKSLRTRLK